MFQYEGQLPYFQDTLRQFGSQLERHYHQLLGRQLESVTRLIAPSLYVDFQRGEKTADVTALNVADEFSDKGARRLFGYFILINDANEILTRELDIRILLALGIDVSSLLPQIYMDS